MYRSNLSSLIISYTKEGNFNEYNNELFAIGRTSIAK
jgi:hypothetical protein